jgi:hypothetical protein
MKRLALLALAAAACGNPDNLVVGSIPLDANTSIGIATVRSAIHAVASVTITQGQPPASLSVIVLSNASDLCSKLQAHPDYFHVSYEQSTSLLLFVPAGLVGDFFFGQQNVAAGIYFGTTPADAGAPGGVTVYPGAGGGQTSLAQFDSEARGSFDWFIDDRAGGLHDFFGRFKTSPCAALASATLP